MTKYNIVPTSIKDSYSSGLLPQRNSKKYFYQETSSRSNLSNFVLSSENKRIINKTDSFTFEFLSLKDFDFTLDVQKTIHNWIKQLQWDFPISSVKNIFQNHIFNYLYIWKRDSQVVAYSICYFDDEISHIAYVFYDPQFARQDLPIRLSLQVIVDSHHKGLSYCYLGRFDPQSKLGYYKRNFPGFEYYSNSNWLEYN